MDVVAERAYNTPLSNSTLLPLLLLSLAKQKHTPEPSTTIMSEYDYVIVGAGSAGSVLASRLSELSCVSVLLLEAGGPPPLLTEVPGVVRFLRGSDIDWQYMTVPQKHTGNGLVNRQVVWTSGKAIGGSSILNNMLYVRGNRKNYDKWAADGAEGWSYKNILPYFKKMEQNKDKEYLANGYHGKHGPITVHRPRYQSEIKDPIFKTAKALGYKVVDPNAARQTGFYDLQSTLRGGQRCSEAKAYLVPAENRTNLDILSHAMVRKVVIKNKRAVGVRFDFQGTLYTVKANKEVILSAGTIRTPQILMLSGIGPKRELERFKIPVHVELPVGKNLQDHIGAFTNFQVKYLPPGSEKLANHQNIMQYIQNRTGPLATADFDSALAFLKNRAIVPKKDFPDHQLYFAEAQSDLFAKLGLRPEVLEQVYGPYRGQGFMICISQLLHPKSRGTVTLKSKNPYEAPAIDPNYLEDPRDIQDMVEGLKTCMRIGTHPIMKHAGIVPFDTLYPGCEKYVGNKDKYFACEVKSVVSSFNSYVGTCKMGDPKDPRTVVDPQLRVLHIKGLRVVDASVIPIITSGNVNIPTVMVAEKASSIIKSTIECNKHEDKWSEAEDPEWSEEPHNYPLGPDADAGEKHKDEWNENEDYNPSDKNHNFPLHPDSDKSDEPHYYPLDPDSDHQDDNEEHEAQWDKKENDDWEEEQQHHISHHDSGPHDSDNKFLKKSDKHKFTEHVWVVPWNKEIPNVIPWNQEIVQSGNFGGNLPLNASLSGNTGIPALPGVPPQVPLNPPTPQLPLNPAQPQTAGNAGLPQLPLTPPAPQLPITPPVPQLPLTPPQSPLTPPQPQLPISPPSISQLAQSPPEIKSYLEPEIHHGHQKSHILLTPPNSQRQHNQKVFPWNKEIPHVVPWNQELFQPTDNNAPGNTNLPASSMQPQAQAQTSLNPPQPQVPLNPVQTQMPGGLPQPPIPLNPLQPQAPANLPLPQIPLNPLQPQAPASLPQPQLPLTPPFQLPSAGMPSQLQGGILSQGGNLQPTAPNLSTLQIQINKPRKVNQMKAKLQQLLQQLLNTASPNAPINSPPESRALIRDIEDLRENTPCDENFCNSLLKFMQCHERSCQKRKEFSTFLYNGLCSS